MHPGNLPLLRSHLPEMRRLPMQAEDALSVLTAQRLYLLLERLAFLQL